MLEAFVADVWLISLMYHIWRHSRVTALLLNCSCTFGPLLFTFNTRLHFTIHISGSPSVTLKIYVYSILFIVLYLAMSVQPIYKLFTTSIRWSVTDFFVTFLFLLALWFFWGFFSVCKLFKIVMYESHMFNCIHFSPLARITSYTTILPNMYHAAVL